ncbi:hypothetical protein YH65_06470 [Sulfurovum lithotrophicum]|uniref:Uncharacterized protein n=1 Tax=Sulfurovum lithotrophicum TaxID=206403 RepID=A0A7U4M1G5_9BACT|nr:hypothetical protein [Sulfurovum lithotrophicum]AKF25077.1 hypothetical protein YH65_06470 [Sulfurovum lithotrophicum]
MSIKYRKRVPSALTQILNCKEIYRTFKTQGEVDTLNALLNECTAIVNSGLPLEITKPIVLDKGLQEHCKQLNVNRGAKIGSIEDC